MSEELEQVEEVVEGTEEVEGSEGQEPAAKEPAQPDADYSPAWLDEPEESEPSGPSQAELDAYYRQMAQWQQRGGGQPQYPQQVQESDLDRLVKDTRGTISAIAREQAQMMAQNLMQQQFGPYAQQMQQFIEGQTRSKVSSSDKSIRKMYEDVFNKDESFVGNSRVKQRVETTLKNMRAQAVEAARMGDYTALDMFNEPGFAQVALAAAKIVEGLNPTSSRPVSTPHQERSAPASKEKKSYTDDLDPDTIEGLKRLYGSNWESRYNKAVEDERKYKDFS